MITDPPETEIVDKYRVLCDGGDGALGHPRVWLQIAKEKGWVEFPYCDKKIIHKSYEQKI